MPNTISGPDTITAKGWYKYTTTDAGQWSTSGDSFKYLEENGNELSFYVDEDVYESHVARIYCNVISTGENLTKEVTVNKTAAEASVDVQAKITTEYPEQYLNPFRSAKLKLSAAGSVGLTSTMKLKWSVDSGQMFKTYETAHDEVTEVTVSDLLNGFKPQGSVPVSITLEIIDNCVVSRAQTMLVMCDVLPDPNTKWTPNYNGVNSYVEIPEWKPAGEFEIECEVYLSGDINYLYVLDGNEVGNRIFLQYAKPDGVFKGSSPVTVISGTGGKGLSRLRMSGNSTTGKVGFIGSQYRKAEYWKGQISNLKLVDKQNPSNSRFYPGIIYNYVDPDAVDVPVPGSTVLVDEWSSDGSTNGIMTNFGTDAPWVQLLSDDSVTFEEMNEEVQTEPKLYTVFNIKKAMGAPYSRFEKSSGEVVLPVYLKLPNAPRLSIDGSKGIVTGVYGEAPEAEFLPQTEAEELMQKKEWSLPEE